MPGPFWRRNAVNANRLLMLYSGVLTAVFALAVATSAGADTRPGKAVFDEIDVKRINVRADDGTIRMIVSNTSRAPGIIVHGQERPHQSRSEERRVGKEGVSTCRSRWSRYQ